MITSRPIQICTYCAPTARYVLLSAVVAKIITGIPGGHVNKQRRVTYLMGMCEKKEAFAVPPGLVSQLSPIQPEQPKLPSFWLARTLSINQLDESLQQNFVQKISQMHTG